MSRVLRSTAVLAGSTAAVAAEPVVLAALLLESANLPSKSIETTEASPGTLDEKATADCFQSSGAIMPARKANSPNSSATNMKNNLANMCQWIGLVASFDWEICDQDSRGRSALERAALMLINLTLQGD